MARKMLEDEEIVAALITEGSIAGAAAVLGCTPRTIYARMKTPAFKELYARTKGEIVKQATAKLQGTLCSAVDTLVEIMKDKETAKQTRVNSAVSLLQYAARYTETTDIIERLEAIESAQAMEGRSA